MQEDQQQIQDKEVQQNSDIQDEDKFTNTLNEQQFKNMKLKQNVIKTQPQSKSNLLEDQRTKYLQPQQNILLNSQKSRQDKINKKDTHINLTDRSLKAHQSSEKPISNKVVFLSEVDQQLMTDQKLIGKQEIPSIVGHNIMPVPFQNNKGLPKKIEQRQLVSAFDSQIKKKESPFLPFIHKKGSVLGDQYHSNIEANNCGIVDGRKSNLLTQTQQVNVHQSWSPYTKKAGPKFIDPNFKSKKNLSKDRQQHVQLAYGLQQEIIEKSPYEEDSIDNRIGSKENTTYIERDVSKVVNNDAKQILQDFDTSLDLQKNLLQTFDQQNTSKDKLQYMKPPINKGTTELKVFGLQNIQDDRFKNNIYSSNTPLKQQSNLYKKKEDLLMKKQKLKIKQQVQREEEIRQYLQNNIHQTLERKFTNTEYSTPGASSKFLEEYLIEQKSLLGSGGYAEVRLATHKPTGHQVAIKIYEKYKLIDVQIKQNLIREIKILWRLQHDNIMKLYEAIDSLSNVYLIMEYVPGLSLSEYMNQLPEKKIEEAKALYILKQLLQAVSYLQKQSMSHRDIKLENIIIDKETCQIKMIDFGFAVYSTKTLKMHCGTACYMAPEIVSKQEYKGDAVDVWCCGIVFYIMLCGHFPFSAHTDRELSRKIQKGIYHVHKEFNKDNTRLISRMLCVNLNNRATADEILNDPYVQSLSFDKEQQDNKSIKCLIGQKQEFEDFIQQRNKRIQHRSANYSQQNTMSVLKPNNPKNMSYLEEDSQFDLQNITNIIDQSSYDIENTLSQNLSIDYDNLDYDTVQNIVKLGFTEEEIKSKVGHEKEMVSQLYRKLVVLKQK